MKKGFTLIELIVSTLIFGLVMAAVIGIYITQMRKSKEVSEKSVLTTETQIALHVLSEEILHTGLGINITEPPITFVDGGVNSSDELSIKSISLPLDEASGRWSIALETGLGSVLSRRWTDTTLNIRRGDSIVVVGPRGNVEITECLYVQNISVIDDSTMIISYTPTMTIQKGKILFQVPSYSVVDRWVTYRLVGDTLFRNNERFMENVEDFQVEFCADWDDDGELDFGDWRSTLPTNYANYDYYSRPLLIKIHLLVRTSSGLTGFNYAQDTVISVNRIIPLSALMKKYPREFFRNVVLARNLKRID